MFGSPNEKRGVKTTKEMQDEGVFVPLLAGTLPAEVREEQHLDSADANRCNKDGDFACPASCLLSAPNPLLLLPDSSRCREPRRKLPFNCEQCKRTEDVLFCSPTTIDGVPPKLNCSLCKPCDWVNISRSDYARALGIAWET